MNKILNENKCAITLVIVILLQWYANHQIKEKFIEIERSLSAAPGNDDPYYKLASIIDRKDKIEIKIVENLAYINNTPVIKDTLPHVMECLGYMIIANPVTKPANLQESGATPK